MNIKNLTILCDMDDCISNLAEEWVSYLNCKYKLKVQFDDIESWEMSEYFPTLTRELVRAPLYMDDFYEIMKPREYAQEYLKRIINDGHNVYIATASVYQTLPSKMKWLFYHYPYLTWDNVIVTSRKQMLKADVLLDDGIHNLEGGDYFKILMDSPYNRSYDAEANGMVRVYNLKEAYEVINKIQI